MSPLGIKSRESDAQELRVLMNSGQPQSGMSTGTAWGVIVLMHASRAQASTFPPNDAGMAAALAAAVSGDMIWVPPGHYAGIVVPANVIVASMGNKTIFDGTIILNGGILGVCVNVIGNSSSPVVAVIGPSVSVYPSYINDCMILATNNGTGNAYGVQLGAGTGQIEIWDSYISGTAQIGATGLGAYREPLTSTAIYMYGGRAVGSSFPFNE